MDRQTGTTTVVPDGRSGSRGRSISRETIDERSDCVFCGIKMRGVFVCEKCTAPFVLRFRFDCCCTFLHYWVAPVCTSFGPVADSLFFSFFFSFSAGVACFRGSWRKPCLSRRSGLGDNDSSRYWRLVSAVSSENQRGSVGEGGLAGGGLPTRNSVPEAFLLVASRYSWCFARARGILLQLQAILRRRYYSVLSSATWAIGLPPRTIGGYLEGVRVPCALLLHLGRKRRQRAL